MSDRDAMSAHILALLHTVTGAVWMHDENVVARTSATFTEEDGLATGEFPLDGAAIDRVNFVDDAGKAIYVVSIYVEAVFGGTIHTGLISVVGI